MKAGPKIPSWAIAVTLVVVVAVVALVGWRTMSPNDPMLDGHGHKIFTPDDIAKFRSQDAASRAPGQK